MPIQAPQWTEVLSCPVCYKDFNPAVRQPVSLSCGHTVCRTCLTKLHRKQCPFDQAAITREVEQLPTNYAILQLVVGPEVMKDAGRERVPDGVRPVDYEIYHATRQIIEELALYLNVLTKATPNGTNGNLNSTTTSSTGGNQVLSRPIQRKLVTLVNCQLVEDEGRARAVRAARSLGERIVTELIIQHQNPQQLSTNLWAAVRARGCQFLGPAMQEETLRLVLLALEDGAALSRKVLVMFVVQKLELQFPQASKTSVGHVVQLLYRASCFKVTKREEESSLMQLKEEFRNYEALRREHDAQIVQIAIEAGLRISPEQWSSLLYGDLNHKSHMQSIIDKLQTPASFASSIQELTISLQRSGDPVKLSMLRLHLDKLASIDPSPEAKLSSWTDVKSAVDAVKKVLQGLVNFVQNYTHNKKSLDVQSQNIKYKTSMCRDIAQKGGCPRGPSCTFAHTEEELEKYRAKSRHLLSVLNGQTTSPRGKVARTSTPPSEISVSLSRTSSISGTERPVLDPVPRLSSVSVPGPGGDSVTSPVFDDDDDDWEEQALPSLAGLKARSEATSRVPKPKTDSLPPRQHISDASLYSDSSDRYPSRGEELRSTDSPPPSAILPPHHAPPPRGSQDSGLRYSSGPSEDGYLYDPRNIHNARGYNHPHDVPRKYQQPVPPPPTKLAPQPQVLIPTSYHPSPRSDDYGSRPGAKHNYPYITPSGGRYAYPTSPTHPRQIIYSRPAHRYVDPHTMKTYDVVPTQDYVEPSAPPQSLLPSHNDYEPGSPWPYDPRELHRDAYYDQQRLGNANVSANGRPLLREHLVAGPGKRDFVDTPDREEPYVRKKSSKPLVSTVITPPSKLRPKEDKGPSLTELKERKIFISNILDDMKTETGGETALPSVTQSSSSTTPPYTSSWPTTAWTSSPSLTSDLPGGLQFDGISDDDDDDDDNDHRKNGIDYDDADVQLLSDSMKLGHEDDDDLDDRYGSQDDRQDSLLFSQGSYNPWTSTALFTPNTGKAVKETPTNYTMTYSKVLVRHVSANENEEQIHKQPLGTHAMQDFESMTMADLQRTLQDVKQQDQRAGCGHHERSSKIQLEMNRRGDDCHPNFPLAPMALAPLPAQLVNKEPILHGYTKYTQANPEAHWGYGRQNDPVARMARSMGRNTLPVQMSAGMTENTTPVTITQDCQVAPGLQAPHGEGYYVLPRSTSVDQSGGQPTHTDDDKLLDQVNWEKSVNNLLENVNPNVAVKKLNRKLDQVVRQISEKESAKNARDVFIVNREETALGNMYHKDPRSASFGGSQPSSVATQMQDMALDRYHAQPKPHDHGQQARAAPPRDHRGHGGRPGQQAVQQSQVESDTTIAKMLYEDEKQRQLEHLREVQRREEQQRAIEQHRRQQEKRDRDYARELARREAMNKGYY